MGVLRLTVQYDGADFAGSQVQPGQRTVQGEFEDAWRSVTGLSERMILAGRTDAGVSAAGQVASVWTECDLEPSLLLSKLAATLPSDLKVLSVAEAADGFDARRWARWRRYMYRWMEAGCLDVEAMRRAAHQLEGERDFTSLSSAGETGPRGMTRRLMSVTVKREPEGVVVFDVVGDAFLRQMVRRLVSALIMVGIGRIGRLELTRAVQLRDRALLPGPALSAGLTLTEVGYGEYAG